MAQRGRPRKNPLPEAPVEPVEPVAEPIAEAPEGDVFVRILWANVGIGHGQKAFHGQELHVSPIIAEMLVNLGAAEYA